ncbi:hypothetical protein ACFL1W_00885 [Candidatus Margulisiibacteriota bacterium]
MKRIIFLSLIVLLAGNGALAGSFTEDLMKTGVGARPMGMGKAFVALADDGFSPFINPAGLAGLKAWSLNSMYVSMFEGDLPYGVISVSRPLGKGNLAVGAIATGTSDIISPSSQALTYFDYYDRLFFLTYAVGNEKISWGSNLKVFSKGFTDRNKGSGFNLDLGLKYTHSEYLRFGLNVQNLLPLSVKWESGAEDAIPTLVKLGCATRFLGGSTLAMDVDMHAGRYHPGLGHLGIEWPVNRVLTLRTGADQILSAASEVATNLTAGVGINVRGFHIDYAYHPYQETFADTAHFVSFSYSPEPRRALPRPRPKKVAPKPKAPRPEPAVAPKPVPKPVPKPAPKPVVKPKPEPKPAPKPVIKSKPKPKPQPKPEVKKEKKYFYHYVSCGETLMSISEKYYGTVRYYKKLAELNDIKDIDKLLPGRYIKIDPAFIKKK